MSDEEKKAIEQFKNFIFTYQDVIEDEYSDYEEKECAKEYQEVSEKIINLIEKQQKEIEKLKSKKYILNAETNEIKEIPISDNYISKDKIKEKISILEKLQKEFLNNNEIEIKIIAYKELLGEQ